MSIFSFLFGGKYPETSKYEAQLAQAKNDFGKFNQIAKGADLMTYEELKKTTATADFKNRVDHLKNDRYKGTSEYQKEQELKQLAKSSDIKGYLKFVASGDAKKADAAIASEAYKEFLALEKVVSTSDFKAKAKVSGSEEAKQLARFIQLKGDTTVKAAVSFAKSSAYANYKKTAGSDRLKKYEALTEYVKTPDFINKKKYLENKNRFKESEEAKQLAILANLEKSKDLKWYFAALKAGTFKEADKWELKFSDEFAGQKVDSKKWLSGYYWGKKTAGIEYSLADERQAFTEANAKVSGGVLTISTRPGDATGTVWSPEALGFVKKNFEASSAVITSGDSFRQKFGKFDFKVKATGAMAPVFANIWLSSDKNKEINVATFGKSKGVTLGAGQNIKAVDDVKYSTGYFIYTLEWTPEKLTWKVNGVEVYSTTQNVPQEEMYICMGSNVVGDGKIGNADMSIEWVKVYDAKAK